MSADEWDFLENWKKEKAAEVEARKVHVSLAMSIKNALTTPSGAILYGWLKQNCFMDKSMDLSYIDSNNAAQRMMARRDLFIELENLLQEGLNHVTDAS